MKAYHISFIEEIKRTLAVIMAGGAGERLYPLTRDRAKPGVPFGGIYRIIDFTLSNCVNSGIKKIIVLTQYKALSLERHIRLGWSGLCSHDLGEYIFTIPPQMRISKMWYQGTADAVYQNLYFIEMEKPSHVLVLSGDHIYKMDYRDFLDFHIKTGADVTLSVVEMRREDAAEKFGIIEMDREQRVIGFEEKPKDPKPSPQNPKNSLISMGVYLFRREILKEFLEMDARDKESSHDFGKDVIPKMIKEARVFGYNFKDPYTREPSYWRDVGTIDAFWEANMELVSVEPKFNLYDEDWPIRTYQAQYPPAKTVFAQEYPGGRMGIPLDSIVSAGCIISGGRVQNCVISPRVRINSFCEVRESVIMDRSNISRYCRIKRAIIDKDVFISPGTEIGYDLDKDRKRFFVSEGGIVVIPKGERV